MIGQRVAWVVVERWHAFRRLQLFRHLHSCSGCFRLERLPGGLAPTYMRARVKTFFLRSAFLLFVSFKESSRGAQFCIDGTAAPFAWRAERSIPQSPEGRAGRREGLTAKARAKRQWCLAITRCYDRSAFLLILFPR